MKLFATDLYSAITRGTLKEPFNAAMAKQACPGWANRTYHTFLGKHAVGNGYTTELFERIGRGMYRWKR